jgi:oxygen-independent coproporphyrinogen III oxidase
MIELTRLYERVLKEIRDFQLQELEQTGLERNLASYYLIGTYPPLAAMQEPGDDVGDVLLPGLKQPVDLYLHFPFCRVMGPFECTFCHFYKEIHDSTLESKYVQACLKELRLYREKLGKIQVRSIYFGGGTFSLISPRNLEHLLSSLGRELIIPEEAEIKFEIHADAVKTPELLNPLLAILKDYGITHIVIDIQTLNEETLTAISWGRIRPGDYFETLETCKSYGFERFVTGLMLGLPFESFDSFQRSVLRLAAIPGIVTTNIFPLMFRPGDAIYQQLRHVPEIFPNVLQRDVMHLGARILLEAFGFYESPLYFMNRRETIADHQTNKFLGNTLLGIGASAFGIYNGTQKAQYYNFPKIHHYMDSLDRDKLPIWRIGMLSPLAWSTRQIILGALNLNKPLDLRELDPEAKIRLIPLMEYFNRLGLLHREGDVYTITPRGRLRAEEMSYFFAEPGVRRALNRLSHNGDLSRYNYFITRSPQQERLFNDEFEHFSGRRFERN